jgi:hypothetical protein
MPGRRSDTAVDEFQGRHRTTRDRGIRWTIPGRPTTHNPKELPMLKTTLTALTLGSLIVSGAFAQSFSESATCKLTNTAENVTLYEGSCRVTQSQSGNNTVFEVKMGDSEPFLFAGQRGQTNWQHGPEAVQFMDVTGGGIFRWGTFALAIAE